MRQEDRKNAYGENHPTEGESNKIDHRVEQDTAEDLDATREPANQEQTSGGMGRQGTPKDGPSQGRFERATPEMAETPRD